MSIFEWILANKKYLIMLCGYGKYLKEIVYHGATL